ncbi:MAG: hypothetical protein ACXVDN_17425 [Ktedonobacteraceae bacterium]
MKVKMSLLLTGIKLSVLVWALPLFSCSGIIGECGWVGGKPYPYISEM